MNFKPIGTLVLLELIEEKTALAMPDGVAKDFDRTRVIVRDAGDGWMTMTGAKVPLPVKAGDRIQLKPSAHGNITHFDPKIFEGRKFGVLDIAHIAGVFEGEMPAPKFARRVLELTH